MSKPTLLSNVPNLNVISNRSESLGDHSNKKLKLFKGKKSCDSTHFKKEEIHIQIDVFNVGSISHFSKILDSDITIKAIAKLLESEYQFKVNEQYWFFCQEGEQTPVPFIKEANQIYEFHTLSLFGKNPKFLVSSNYNLKITTPWDEVFNVKMPLSGTLNILKKHLPLSSLQDQEEILFFITNPIDLVKVRLTEEILIQNASLRLLTNNQTIKLDLCFASRIDILFKDSHHLFVKRIQLSSNFQIKALKHILEKKINIEWEKQIWDLTNENNNCQECIRMLNNKHLSDYVFENKFVLVSEIDRNEFKIYEYEYLQDWIQSYPHCLERNLWKLYYDLHSNAINQNQIEENIKNIKQLLQRDFVYHSDIIHNFENPSQDPSLLMRTILTVLKKMNPVNIEEVKKWVSKIQRGVNLISGQRAYVLLGDSCSGKSTTLCFLNSLPLIQNKEGNIEIASNEIKPPCNINYSDYSMTQFMQPIILNKQKLLFCDTAGFRNTLDIENDIANSIGMISALRKTKEVKPILVIKKKGDCLDFQQVISLIKSLIKMIKNIKFVIDSFFYIFTGFSLGEEGKIKNFFLSLSQRVMFEDLNEVKKKNILTVIDHMFKNIYILCPSSENPELLLKKFQKSDSYIKEPDLTFELNLSKKSKKASIDQAMQIIHCIKFYLNQNNYIMIEYKIKQLMDFSNMLPFLSEIYEESIFIIREGILEKFKMKSVIFDHFLDPMSNFEFKEIEAFSNDCNGFFKDTANLRQVYLKSTPFLNNEYFTIRLKSFINQIQDCLSENENQLFKIILISFFFPVDSVAKFLIEIRRKVEVNLNSLEEFLEADNFKETGQILDEISKFSNFFKQIPINILRKTGDFEEMKTKREDSIQIVAFYFEKFKNLTILQIKNQEFSNFSLKLLTTSLNRLEKIQKQSNFFKYCDNEDIISFKNELTSLLMKCVEKINGNLDDEMKSLLLYDKFDLTQSSLKMISDFIPALQEIQRSFESMKVVGSKMIQEWQNILRRFLKKIENDIEHMFESSPNQMTPRNFKKLNQIQVLLKENVWINQFLQNSNYFYIITTINDGISEYFQEKIFEFENINISLGNESNLEQSVSLVSHVLLLKKYHDFDSATLEEELHNTIQQALNLNNFDFLDSYEKSEKVYKYAKKVINLRNHVFLLKNEIEKAKKILEDIEKKILCSIEKSKSNLLCLIQKIQNFIILDINNESDLNSAVKAVVKDMQSLNKMMENEIFSVFPPLKECLNDIDNKIKEVFNEIKDEIETSLFLEDHNTIILKLVIISQLSRLDTFGFGFKDLGAQKKQKHLALINEMASKCEKYINDGELLSVQRVLDEEFFKEVIKQKDSSFIEIRRVEKKISKIQENFFYKLEDLFQIIEDDLTEFEGNMFNSQAIKNIGLRYLKLKKLEKLNQNRVQIFLSRFTKILKVELDSIFVHLKNFEFKKGEVKFNNLCNILPLMARILPEEAILNIEKLINEFTKKRQDSLDSLVEETKKRKISVIQIHSIEDILEELKKIECDEKKIYFNTFLKILEIQQSLIIDQIELSEKENDKDEKKFQLCFIKDYLELMPKQLKLFFSEKINNALKKIEL